MFVQGVVSFALWEVFAHWFEANAKDVRGREIFMWTVNRSKWERLGCVWLGERFV